MEKTIQKFSPPRTVFHRNFCVVRRSLYDGLLKIPMVTIVKKN